MDIYGSHLPTPEGTYRSHSTVTTKLLIGCLTGCGIVALLVVGLSVIAFRNGLESAGRAETVGMTFLKSVNAGDAKDSYARTGPEFKQNVSAQAWQAYMLKWRRYAGEFNKVTETGKQWRSASDVTIVRVSYTVAATKHEEHVILTLQSVGGPFRVIRCDVQPLPP